MKDAKKLGNVCAQKNFFTQEVIGNDDCLYLNVFTTDLNLNDPKSVMVWIHGGAFAYGSGNDDRFGADYIVQKNIVLVTINYRLGIFGKITNVFYILLKFDILLNERNFRFSQHG